MMSVVEMRMCFFFLTTVQVKVEMALKVENYNYTKELQNKSSLQYKLIEKNFTNEVWFVFLLSSLHSLSPHSLLFSPRLLAFCFSSFLCSLFLPPVISSFPSHSPLTLQSLSFFPLSLPCMPFRPSFFFSPPFPFFALLRFPFQHSTISPTLSLSSVLPPSLLFLWILTFLLTVCSYQLFHRMTYQPSFSPSLTSSIGSML